MVFLSTLACLISPYIVFSEKGVVYNDNFAIMSFYN